MAIIILVDLSFDMPEALLTELLERNLRHTEALPSGYFESVQAGQEPAVVSVCCSDSRVSQEGMWDVETPGWLFTPSTIGNQVWDRHKENRVVDGSVLFPMVHTGTRVATVVGHTGCGGVTAALEAVQRGEIDQPPGIGKWVGMLVPVIEAGLEDERIDRDGTVSLVNQLVEFNVDRQVGYLQESDEVPDEMQIYGFVYDFQGVYGDEGGRAYLVNANGETDVDALRQLVPDQFATWVNRLL